MVCGKQSGLLWALQILKIFVGIFWMSDKINELHPSPRGVTCHVSVTTVVFIPTYYLIIISICTCAMLQIDNANSDCSPQVQITKCRSIKQKPSPTFWSPWPSRWAVNTRRLSQDCHPSTRNYYRNISRLVATFPVWSQHLPSVLPVTSWPVVCRWASWSSCTRRARTATPCPTWRRPWWPSARQSATSSGSSSIDIIQGVYINCHK